MLQNSIRKNSMNIITLLWMQQDCQDCSDWTLFIMEESLHSTTSFTNDTSNYTSLTITQETVTDDDSNIAEIIRLMHVYGRPVIIVFGTLGNVLAFIVMRRGSMRHVSTCFYMAILALADTGQWMLTSISNLLQKSFISDQQHTKVTNCFLSPSIEVEVV